MPIMKNYRVEVDVTVRVYDDSRSRTVMTLSVEEHINANSYDPDKMITPATHAAIENASEKIWGHTTLAEAHEAKRN